MWLEFWNLCRRISLFFSICYWVFEEKGSRVRRFLVSRIGDVIERRWWISCEKKENGKRRRCGDYLEFFR